MLKHLYVLRDPRDKRIRYIGVTAGLLSHRLGKHVFDRRLSTDKGKWILELHDLGLRPVIEAIAEVGDDWRERERLAIKQHREAGCDLLNISEGGYGHAGAMHTKETKARISAKKKGRPFIARDPASRSAKLSATLRKMWEGKSIVPHDHRSLVLRWRKEGRSVRAIAAELNVNWETINRLVKAV
jgi:DNA-binding NarL/FixJ family response regulator